MKFVATIVTTSLALACCGTTAPVSPESFVSPPTRGKPPLGYLVGVIVPSDITLMLALSKYARETHAQSVVLHIDSPGGDLDAARKITTLIADLQGDGIRTDCVVDGDGWSAAAYVLQGCGRRYMTRRSTIMFHQSKVTFRRETDGPMSAIEEVNLSEANRTVNLSVAEYCARRLHLDVGEFQTRIADGLEWWLDWHQAIAVGAVDAIVGSSQDLVTR